MQVLSLAFLATVTNAEITHQLPLRPKHGHGPKGPYGPPHPHPTPLGPYGPVKHYGVKPKPYTPAPYHATTVSNSYYSVRCFGNINISKMLPARLLGFLKKFLPTLLLRPLIDFYNFQPTLMVVRVVEFSSWGYKIWKIFAKNQHTQKKLLNFENWCNGEVSKSAKIQLSKSIFYAKNHRNLSHFFSMSNSFFIDNFW